TGTSGSAPGNELQARRWGNPFLWPSLAFRAVADAGASVIRRVCQPMAALLIISIAVMFQLALSSTPALALYIPPTSNCTPGLSLPVAEGWGFIATPHCSTVSLNAGQSVWLQGNVPALPNGDTRFVTLVAVRDTDPPPLNGSTLKYGFDHEGGPQWQTSDTSPTRSSRSFG